MLYVYHEEKFHIITMERLSLKKFLEKGENMWSDRRENQNYIIWKNRWEDLFYIFLGHSPHFIKQSFYLPFEEIFLKSVTENIF